MQFLQLMNEWTQRQVARSKLPTLDDLKAHLEKQYGQVKVTGNETRLTVTLPRNEIPEILEDKANRILRAFGLDYTDLRPGKPKETGMTRIFTIYGPEINSEHWEKKKLDKQRKKDLNNLLDLEQDRRRRNYDPFKTIKAYQ